MEFSNDGMLHIAFTEQSFSDQLKLKIVHLGVKVVTNIHFLIASINDRLIVNQSDLAQLL